MLFDVIVGNPPFNSWSGGKAGTGGNTRLYHHFHSAVFSHLKENGLLLFVCMRGIMKSLIKNRQTSGVYQSDGRY